jgi:hypothetical protein
MFLFELRKSIFGKVKTFFFLAVHSALFLPLWAVVIC